MNIRKIFKNSFESKSSYPKLEDLKPKKSYVITISPQDEIELKIIQTYNNLMDNLIHLFHANIKMYTEISTLNQIIHYHGFIRWSSYLEITKFYLNIQNINKLCHFEIDEYNDPEQWWPYIVKQCPHMDSICHSMNVPNLIKYIYPNIETESQFKIRNKAKGRLTSRPKGVRDG